MNRTKTSAQKGCTCKARFRTKLGRNKRALTYVSFGNSLESVKLLLKSEADINAKTESGRNALMIAIDKETDHIVTLPAKQGARLD